MFSCVALTRSMVRVLGDYAGSNSVAVLGCFLGKPGTLALRKRRSAAARSLL
jgi:hypothetical protein